MNDADLLALNVLEEAGGEIDDGKAAIARIVLNRMCRRFFSDGTITGTVLRKDQFSWAWFAMNPYMQYVRISFSVADAQARAQNLFNSCDQQLLGQCEQIAANVLVGAYNGTFYDQLTDDAVLYCNPAKLTKLPAWAIPEARVCSIGSHIFYRSVSAPAPLVA